MIRIELPKLISTLNAQSKLALEQAAVLCMEQQHSEVTVSHYIAAVLENPLSDLRVILKQANIEPEAILQTIRYGYPHDKTQETYPAFSPLLVELLQEAWLLSSTELGQSELRSGAILLTALMRAERYMPPALARQFETINRETLKKQFAQIVAESAEENSQKQNALWKQNEESVLSVASSDNILDKYGTNMTEQARQKLLDPVLCRDDEINLMIDILCRRRKNNPIVVGDAGVGKSAVVEGVAQRIVSGAVPQALRQVELYALDLGLLQAGAAVKGEFEKRLTQIIDAIKHAAQPIILFIDEAHTLIGAGNQEGGSDAANLLKPALARGELSTIAATTWKEYKKYFEKDPALTRRFQLVALEEPSVAQTVDILRGLHGVYESAHDVLITDEALIAAAELSARYLAGRQLPDKAIDVLDTACARTAIHLTAPPLRLASLETAAHQRQLEIGMLERAQLLGQEMDETRLAELKSEAACDQQEYEMLNEQWQQQKACVAALSESRNAFLQASAEQNEPEKQRYTAQIKAHYADLQAMSDGNTLIHPQVDAQQVAQVIADWTGVPVDQMSSDELYTLTNLTSILTATIKGQDFAIERIHQYLLTARADLRRSGRPKGAFLLVGPSGVGKTETVVQLAEKLYGGKSFLTTINMSEFQEKHTVSRLIGSPPGYVGFGEGGVLTEAIRKKPYSIVLLDEVEKAHPEVLNLFYQAFDKGELTDGEGRMIDCQNIVFFMTSNLGDHIIVDHANNQEIMDELLYPELAAFFKPALLARMAVIPYMPLGTEQLTEIVREKLAHLERTLQDRYTANVTIDTALIDEILARATRSENGARMLEAVIEGQLLPPVSLALLNKLATQQPISSIHLSVQDGAFHSEVLSHSEELSHCEVLSS